VNLLVSRKSLVRPDSISSKRMKDAFEEPARMGLHSRCVATNGRLQPDCTVPSSPPLNQTLEFKCRAGKTGVDRAVLSLTMGNELLRAVARQNFSPLPAPDITELERSYYKVREGLMSRISRISFARVIRCWIVLAGSSLLAISANAAEQPGAPRGGPDTTIDKTTAQALCHPAAMGSPYIPVDSWVYPAMLRLYSLGFIDHIYLGMRPWTRASMSNMLDEAGAKIEDDKGDAAADEAEGLYEALSHELRQDIEGPCQSPRIFTRVESVYSSMRSITGTPLRDSYHFGSTIINDYGRPYANGFDNYSGASGYAAAGRFQIYARGEFQEAPSAAGYSSTLASKLAVIDQTTYYLNTKNLLPPALQATIPVGPIAEASQGRVMEAYVSATIANHVISFGKQDEWLGPAQGASMAYSNNAENVYAFRVNRTEPLYIPWLSRFTGPFRYEFLVGPLKGHTYPIDPWMHVEKVSFRPTRDLEFGFLRTIIWGGKGHEPITIETFLRGFFSFAAPDPQVKDSSKDPGARFGSFDFSYRLPGLRNWLTLYSDSFAHDSISPPSHVSNASWRPGLYLSHVPGLPKLDVRLEGAYTDPPFHSSVGGNYMYWETIQRQGYTNSGSIMGDWMGREAKGGQGWLTWHLSGNEWLQGSFRTQKAANDFLRGGTTLSDINFQAVKRIGKDFEINGNFAFEHYKAPLYLSGQQTVTTTTIQLTWYPERKVSF